MGVGGRRVPSLGTAAIAKVVHGPEAFTPDGEFLLGETAVRGLWAAAGFCVHGLAAAGGVGKVMAEWIVDGSPEYDVFGMDLRRFGGHARRLLGPRQGAGLLLAVLRHRLPGRGAHRRPAAAPLAGRGCGTAELGAAFGEKAGWERVNWFASTRPSPDPRDAARAARAGPGRTWSPAIRPSAWPRATRRDCSTSPRSRSWRCRGAGAAAVLQRLCANDLDRPVGSLVYTQLLNERGGIEADLTVTRLAEDRFRLVTGTAFGVHDAAWLRRHGLDVRDVTYGATPAAACGARRARDILGAAAADDLTFGYMRASGITVGNVPVLAQRVTFVGEFGWELYCPSEYGLTLWDTLMEAGAPHGMRPAGYRAIDSMRLEKGYRVWGLTSPRRPTPDEAGLGFAVATDKDFLGRDALAGRAAAAPPALPRAGRPARSASAASRCGSAAAGGPRDQRRIRPPRRPLDRLRLPALHGGGGRPGGGRHLRRLATRPSG